MSSAAAPAPGRRLFGGFLDDAALFPPARLPVHDAVPAHLVHRVAPHADLVGPFVVAPAHLVPVADAVAGRGIVAFTVAMSGAAAAVRAALTEVPHDVDLVCLEVAGPVDEALDVLGAATVAGYAEVGLRRPQVVVEADLDRVLLRGARAKFRTGGTTAEAFPNERELALGIVGCARRQLPFKLTAGLHDPARHRDPVTGFQHHGLLNVLLATSAAADGADVDEVAAVLADRDEAGLAVLAAALDSDRVDLVRSLVQSVGTCSVDECVAGLSRVGLLPARASDDSRDPSPGGPRVR